MLLAALTLLYPYIRFAVRGHSQAYKIFTHLTNQEKLFLYRVALCLGREKVVVEIGSYLGASSCFLAAAAQDRKSKLFCVDTWKNDGMSEGLRDTYDEFVRNVQRYRSTIVPLRGKSEDIVRTFTDPIDLLFIDGDHSYGAVMKDVESWLPKLKRGAMLILHDSGWAEGVRRAITEAILPLQWGDPKILPNLYAVRIDPGRLSKQE